jgi:hypothetical protein
MDVFCATMTTNWWNMDIFCVTMTLTVGIWIYYENKLLEYGYYSVLP